jgi:hypothetical protein
MLLSPVINNTNMENEMDYLVADENCRIALRELMFTSLKTKWQKITQNYSKR